MGSPLVVAGSENKVCRLDKSLYLLCLKLSPRQWYTRFDDVVTGNGFVRNEAVLIHTRV